MIDLQPVLQDDVILLKPLQQSDFDSLYSAASDPLIWDQHPNKYRYTLPEFTNFFTGAMASGGAFLIIDKESGNTAGGTRFYDWEPEIREIKIGYTFFSRPFWGKGYNLRAKKLMLDHAFSFADTVVFHVGAVNQRSQHSLEKLPVKKIGEMEVTYFGEAPKLNVVYEMCKRDWVAFESEMK